MFEIKKSIKKIEPYRTGKSAVDGLSSVIKLSSNENPFGTSIKASNAYRQASENLNRYPIGSSERLIDGISEIHNLNYKKIICGSGSDELIKLISYAFLNEGDEAVISEFGFIMYKISTLGAGATPVIAKETDYTTNIDSYIKAVTDKTKICFIANPNNPTGTYISKEEIIRLRNSIPQDIIIVIDSAYAEYIEQEDYCDGSDLVDNYNNIIMLRTFSKIYALAALRLGWAYASEEILDILNRIRPPFNVNLAAQAAGLAALYDRDFIQHCVKQNHDIKDFMTEALKHNGLKPIKSYGNFLLVKFDDDKKTAEKANDFLLGQGIITRPVGNYGINDCLRISVGNEEEVKTLIRTLANFMNL